MKVNQFIKPCPLCGKELSTCNLTVGNAKGIQGQCQCGLSFSIQEDIYGPDEPLKVWNTRILEEELKQQLNEELKYTAELVKALKAAGAAVPKKVTKQQLLAHDPLRKG
jgi:transcription elongation factor Elf1